MNTKRLSITFLTLLFLNACVTINVYFPAAAAEKAADKIIDEVWGKEGEDGTSTPSVPEESNLNDAIFLEKVQFSSILSYLIADAYAAANIDISSPEIQAIKDQMAARHENLSSYYDNGAIGIKNNAFITLRDSGAVSLKMRNKVTNWVAEENQDRLALYREIARENGHPEWEDNIRTIFADRWISRAKGGWYYQDPDGNWMRK